MQVNKLSFRIDRKCHDDGEGAISDMDKQKPIIVKQTDALSVKKKRMEPKLTTFYLIILKFILMLFPIDVSKIGIVIKRLKKL